MSYTPDIGKSFVEKLAVAELAYEKAKLKCDYTEAKNKATLAEIEINLIDTQGCPIGKAKSLALASKQWAEKVEEYYKVIRWELVKAECHFNDLKRQLEENDRGMSWNQTMVKSRVFDNTK